MAMADYGEARALLKSYVGQKVNRLQKMNFNQSSQTKGELAQLRRAAGMKPGSVSEIWEVEFGGFPEQLAGKGNEPSLGEWAAHIALTLYATHQQSQSAPMHVSGKMHGLGDAVRTLQLVENNKKSKDEQSGRGMPRRFASLINASDPETFSHYGRQIVKQLRANQIPLDYGELAADVYGALNPYYCDGVKLNWCRQYVQPSSPDQENADNQQAAADEQE